MIGQRKTHHFTKLAKYNQGASLQQVFRWEAMTNTVTKTRTGREGPSLARNTSGSKTAPLYTGFAVVLLFRSCLLLWISCESKRSELEERCREPHKFNFIFYCLAFPWQIRNGANLSVSLKPQQRQAYHWEQIRRTSYSHLSESKTMLSYDEALCDQELNSRQGV